MTNHCRLTAPPLLRRRCSSALIAQALVTHSSIVRNNKKIFTTATPASYAYERLHAANYANSEHPDTEPKHNFYAALRVPLQQQVRRIVVLFT